LGYLYMYFMEAGVEVVAYRRFMATIDDSFHGELYVLLGIDYWSLVDE